MRLDSINSAHTITAMSNRIINHVDAKGLICPVPLMLLKKAVAGISVGEQLTIEVTDIHAELDFEIWCERFGHSLEKTNESEDVLCFRVVK